MATNTLSRLEALPNEVLQEILILSCNPDLALASPELNKSLSSEYIYRRLIRTYFFEDSNSYLWSDTPDARRLLGQYQGRLLRCRWMTSELFKEVVLEQQPSRGVLLRVQDLRDLPARLIHGPWTDHERCTLELLLNIWNGTECRACTGTSCDNSPIVLQMAKDAILYQDLATLKYILGAKVERKMLALYCKEHSRETFVDENDRRFDADFYEQLVEAVFKHEGCDEAIRRRVLNAAAWSIDSLFMRTRAKDFQCRRAIREFAKHCQHVAFWLDAMGRGRDALWLKSSWRTMVVFFALPDRDNSPHKRPANIEDLDKWGRRGPKEFVELWSIHNTPDDSWDDDL